MLRFRSLALMLPLCAVLCGGCPWMAGNADVNTPNFSGGGGGGGGGNGGGNSGASTTINGTSVGKDELADTLTLSFPDCTRPVQAETWRAQILQMVNDARSQEGLGTLVFNDTLEAQAEQYACELIDGNFFDHVSPVTGSTLADRAAEFGYHYQVVGENLAAGQRTPVEVFSDWMNSPGHRANIMHPEFTEVGIGIRSGGQYGFYWVQEFGEPLF